MKITNYTKNVYKKCILMKICMFFMVFSIS